MRSLLLLGSTGSIGTQTLDLVRRARERYAVRGLVAGSSWEVLLEQAREFRPAVVALADPAAAERLARPDATDRRRKEKTSDLIGFVKEWIAVNQTRPLRH